MNPLLTIGSAINAQVAPLDGLDIGASDLLVAVGFAALSILIVTLIIHILFQVSTISNRIEQSSKLLLDSTLEESKTHNSNVVTIDGKEIEL